MRWGKNECDFSKVHGKTRTKHSVFLWLPKTISTETRWLERACWEEEFRIDAAGWLPNCWIDLKNCD